MPSSFDSIATLWSRALAGDGAAIAELADVLHVPEAEVETAGAIARVAAPRADVAAVVGTVRARMKHEREDDANDASRLSHLRDAILACTREFDGFADAFARVRPALLAGRPRLETLRGRARVLEEVRRDLVRDPNAELPEDLGALLDDAPPAATASPPLTLLEQPTASSLRNAQIRSQEKTMTITAREVVTRNVLTVRDDLPIEEVAAFFENHRISGAPVVTSDGVPIGVVSLSDLARSSIVRSSLEEPHDFYVRGLERFVSHEEKLGFRGYGQASTPVRDIMTPVVFSLDETSSVQEVAQAMLTGRIHRVFVTRAGKIVGIVSAMDLLPLVRDLA